MTHTSHDTDETVLDAAAASKRSLLTIANLSIELTNYRPRRPLVQGVSLTVKAGQSVGLVGESGSGKSMTIKAAMRLLPDTARVSGQIEFDGQRVTDMKRPELMRYRADDVAMIHQDPRSHTNPTQTIGSFLIEGVVTNRKMTKGQATERAIDLLKEMGITDAARRMRQYPHELSGGLLQRVMIVAALMGSPRFIFADEPTTALDVTVQSEVMAILVEQIEDRQLGMLFVTHDLDLAAAVTDTLVVMYAGTVVESARAAEVYGAPKHPYSAALLASRPSATRVKRLVSIPGKPAAAYEVGPGCVFADRCPYVEGICRTTRPELRRIDAGLVACHRAEELSSKIKSAVSA